MSSFLARTIDLRLVGNQMGGGGGESGPGGVTEILEIEIPKLQLAVRDYVDRAMEDLGLTV